MTNNIGVCVQGTVQQHQTCCTILHDFVVLQLPDFIDKIINLQFQGAKVSMCKL